MIPRDRASITVQVHPNAARNGVIGVREGVLHVRIAAPPVDGKANRELVSFLSERLGIGRGSISIHRGITGRRKTVTIAGLERDEILGLLGL